MKTMFFLSGLPRSGSTVLSAILNQNPDICCPPTSPLPMIVNYADFFLAGLEQKFTFEVESKINSIKALFNAFHSHRPEKYVIDKHRVWVAHIDEIIKLGIETPKIICTTRRISETVVSFMNLGIPMEQAFNMVRKEGIDYIKIGMEKYPQYIHLIDYNDLINSPQEELNKIYDFLEIEKYIHDFNNIPEIQENDDLWGIDNLHKIRSKLDKISPQPEDILGNFANYFDSFFEGNYKDRLWVGLDP